jgi:hypothetical protein
VYGPLPPGVNPIAVNKYHIVTFSVCYIRENRGTEGFTFLMGLNKITVMRVPWNSTIFRKRRTPWVKHVYYVTEDTICNTVALITLINIISLFLYKNYLGQTLTMSYPCISLWRTKLYREIRYCVQFFRSWRAFHADVHDLCSSKTLLVWSSLEGWGL